MIKIFGTYKKGVLSGLEILVLKIIENNGGITGYEIIQQIARNPRGLWRGTAGSIYPLLKNFAEKKRLVRVEEIVDKNRPKKKYFITEKGTIELKNALSNNILPSMHSFMDSIFTLIGDIPRVKRNVENMFCSFPYHKSVIETEINEADLSLQNQRFIENFIKKLENSREHLKERIKIIDERVNKLKSLLEKITKEREQKSKPIEILEDTNTDYYS